MATAKKNAVEQAETLFDKPKAAVPTEKVMSQYQTLLAQHAELEAQIEAMREQEVTNAYLEMRESRPFHKAIPSVPSAYSPL